jgi:hypothetical protein
MHESSPALAFATGDSPYSKLDMLAAAASEAAGQAQTPAVSDHSHEMHPAAAHGAHHIPHVPLVPTVEVAAVQGLPNEMADGFYTPRQTTSADAGVGLSHRGGVEDGRDALNSPGGRSVAAAAAHRNKRLRERENEACNGPVNDSQKWDSLGNMNGSVMQAGATSEGRDLHHSSASLVRSSFWSSLNEAQR